MAGGQNPGAQNASRSIWMPLTPLCWRQWRRRAPAADDLAAANVKPRLRMTVLYYLAAKHNYLVTGTQQ